MPAIPMQCTMVSLVAIRGAGDAAEVLLLHRAEAHLQGLWSYVAGHIEPGEKAWQCALRELREETGLTPHALYASDRCETYYDPHDEVIAVVPAFVAFVDADASVQLNAESDAWRWLPFAQAMPLLAFGGQRELFAHVQREFVERPPAPVLRLSTGPDGHA